MKNKELEDKIAETIFWIVISPFVSIWLSCLVITTGFMAAFETLKRYTKEYVLNIMQIWETS